MDMGVFLVEHEPLDSRAMIRPGSSEIKPEMPWPLIHYLDVTLLSASANVALDEALLVEAEERGGAAILRIWELGHLAVVLGASCRLRENVRIDACRAEVVEIARRSSGGGTVVIGPGALNFSVCLPIDVAPDLKSVDTAQRYVLTRTLEAIKAKGVPKAEMLGSGDLTLEGRKFSGSAQRRLRHHVLVHASILYDFDVEAIDRYTLMPPRRPVYRDDRPHADFVANLPLPRHCLVSALKAAWLPNDGPEASAVIPDEALRTLLDTKFTNPGWIERL
jgi:lipoate---protein ligase